MNYLKPLILFSLFIVLSVLQVTVVQLISLDGILPFLPIYLIIYISFVYSKAYSFITVFILGFLFDLFTTSVMGVHSFSFLIISYVAGNMKRYFDENAIFIKLFTGLFLLSLIYFISENLFIVGKISFVNIFILSGILPAIYNTLIILPFLFIEKTYEIFINE